MSTNPIKESLPLTHVDHQQIVKSHIKQTEQVSLLERVKTVFTTKKCLAATFAFGLLGSFGAGFYGGLAVARNRGDEITPTGTRVDDLEGAKSTHFISTRFFSTLSPTINPEELPERLTDPSLFSTTLELPTTLETTPSSKPLDFEHLVYLLTNPFFGENARQPLGHFAAKIETLGNRTRALESKAIQELHIEDDVDQKQAESLVGFFSDSKNVKMIRALIDLGVRPIKGAIPFIRSNKFCLTKLNQTIDAFTEKGTSPIFVFAVVPFEGINFQHPSYGGNNTNCKK